MMQRLWSTQLSAFVFTLLFWTPNATTNKIDVDEDVNSIKESIFNYAKKVTNYHKINKEFNALHGTKDLFIRNISGRKIVNAFKSNLEKTFKEKTEALRKIKNKVEVEQNKHVYKEKIEISYFNMDEVNATTSLRIDESFLSNISVNMSYSFVQVPTTIYANSTEILNQVEWTESLDETFRENYKSSKGKMLFQFYGDSSGLFRVYPGTVIGGISEEQKEKAKFFDARRRGWYLQASSSPKDVVIMIDVSGSMAGSRVGIARITATSLIDTLTENDFFNVITVANEVLYMRPCTKYLIQATRYNKEKMKIALQKLGMVSNVTNATLGFTEAFKILNSGPTYNRTSASCNQAIMFISDGVESDYIAKKVFEKHNANKTVRAFAFLIGHIENKQKRVSLVNMACDNRGYYYHIESLGNVWNTVLHYTTVMSRPMSKTKTNTTVYSPIYLDAAGQGMVMTLSMGIFDDNGVIGVAGTDMMVDTLLEEIPFHRLSTFSRIFVIDNNGFVTIHPKFHKHPGYVPPHRNIYLEDIEHGVDRAKAIKIKMNMINRVKNGEDDFSTYWLYDNEDKLVELDAKIYYQPIDETEFSAAVVIPTDGKWNIEYSGGGLEKLIQVGIKNLDSCNESKNKCITEIARWKYCEKSANGKSPKSVQSYYTSKELKEVIKQNNNVIPTRCDTTLVKKLLATVGIVNKHVNESWTTEILDSTDSVFVSTHGGYVKAISTSSKLSSYQRPFQEAPYFEYVSSHSGDVVTLSVPTVDSDARKIVTLTSAVRVGTERVVAAVSGVTFDYNQLSKLLKDGSQMTFEASDSFMTLLIDRNGFIVFSNQGKASIGRRISEISSHLMDRFESEGIFKKIQLEDPQAECEAAPDKCVNSSSNFLLTPLKFVFNGLYSLFRTIGWIVIQYCMLLGTPVYTASHSAESVIAIETKPMISCTNIRTFYLFQEEKLAAIPKIDNDIRCSSTCIMYYGLRPVPGTNLIFVKVKMASICRRNCKNGKKSSLEIKEEDGTQRYRRKPRNCCNVTIENENSRAMCGRSASLKPSLLILFVSVLTWWKVC